MSFLLWVAMLVGGLLLKAQHPEPFDGAYTAGTVLVWVAVGLAIINVLIIVLFLMFAGSGKRKYSRF